MNCARLEQVLDAYLDHELDAATGRDIEQHLEACPRCSPLHVERLQLRERVRSLAPRFGAPESLRGAVRSPVTVGKASARAAARTLSWWRAGWFAAGSAACGVLLGIWLAQAPQTPRAAEDLDHLVANHAASLSSTERLTEVTSSDRHSVKPWFAGKTDFAPPVPDLSAEGYALLGARLDRVQPATATIVYRMRKHTISLYVRRDERAVAAQPVVMSGVRGFGVASWGQDGLRLVAVSDLSRRDLARFAELVRGGS